jgi:peptidoglycan/LPS O-acetylase OafA/YrhL
VSRFNEEMQIIPRATWLIAIAVCVVLPVLACLYWATFVLPAGASKFPPAPVLVTGALISVSLFLFILLIGYIAGDARRRGMRVVLWVLLAIFIPNAIGIILYFIMREPLLRRCPACGASSSSAFSFCPSCGGAISAACPACRSAVEPGWSHCARCGATLRTA